MGYYDRLAAGIRCAPPVQTRSLRLDGRSSVQEPPGAPFMNSIQPTTQTLLRPRFEGANIRTWIGFKHLLYMVEEAILQWFREHGPGPQSLFHEHGLELEIMDCSAQLIALLEIDDEVIAEAAPSQGNQFAVRLLARRRGSDVVSVKAKVQLALIPEKGGAGKPLPGKMATWAFHPAVSQDDLLLTPGQSAASALTPAGSRAFLWPWRARYFHCHYSDRVQHSAYVRALEEVVDRFLEARGISVERMLRDYRWIPVVSRVRVTMLADAHMEETVYTTFTVDDVMKGITFDGRMDCYVQRGNRLVHTATARILHGYAISEGERAGQLTELDQATIVALTAESRS